MLLRGEITWNPHLNTGNAFYYSEYCCMNVIRDIPY